MTDGDGRKQSGKSVWMVLGIGCLVIGLIAVLGFGVCSYYAVRKAKEIQHTMSDPAARDAAACQLLGCEKLPEGYHAAVSVPIPFVVDTVILSDKASGAAGQPSTPLMDKHGLLYVRLRVARDTDRRLEEFFLGKSNDYSVLKEHHVNIPEGVILRRGVIEGTPRYLYLVQRGHTSMEFTASESLMALTFADCPNDSQQRIVIWIGPTVPPAAEGQEPDLGGTVGDEAVLKTFLAQFNLCR